jgi:hypothetical protein
MIPRYRLATLLAVFFFSCAAVGDATAQNLTGGIQAQGTSYHVFARPGQNTILVTMVGSGIQTGLYELGEGTDLEQLVALAGFDPGARQARNRRSIIIQLYREDAQEQRQLVHESSLQALVAAENPAPVLQLGDVVRVEVINRERFSWRDGLRIVTAAASLALIIERLSRSF